MPARYQPLLVTLAAACAGIVVDRRFGFSMPAWLATALLALVFWWLLWRGGRDRIAGIALLAVVATVGGAWHHWRWHFFAADEIGLFARELQAPVCVEAVATSGTKRIPPPQYDPLRPPQFGDETRLEIRLTAIRDGDEMRSASGPARLVVDGDLLDVQPGDRLTIFGRISTPSPAGNPGETDYAELARGRRELVMIRSGNPQCIATIGQARWWQPDLWIERLRSAGDQLLWRNLSHQEAGLAAAVLLGSRDELDPQRIEPFMLTNSIHVLVVAGFHVGVLAYLLFKALRTGWIPRGLALAAVIGVTLLYALLTEAEAPVLRATVVVWIVCGSIWLGRGGLGMNSLALAGLIVLAINPTELFRVGTQLSFLSVAGLILFRPLWQRKKASLDPLDRLIADSRPWPVRMLRQIGAELREVTLMGATIWLTTLPLVMARFHLVAPTGILLNPLLMVPVALAMAAGFGVLVFGWLVPPLGAAFGWLCDFNLRLLETAIDHAAAIPGGHVWVPGPRDWWLAGFYLGVAWLALAPPHWSPIRWRWGALIGWCGVGFGAAWLAPLHGKNLDCTFVSVGHGCAEVLELPSGGVILSDAGRLGSPSFGAREIAGYLWSRGVTHLDAIVLSHNDTDHFNAVPDLLERFSCGAIYVSPVMFNRDTSALAALQTAVERHHVVMLKTSAGDRLATGDATTIRILHPPAEGMGGSENADSIVLAIEFAGRRILLTGDLASPGLDAVVAQHEPPFDVSMVPHHGSATSNPPVFAAWVRTPVAIISGDLTHDSHVAVEAYQQAGSTVLNTATSGAVHIEIQPAGTLHIDQFRRGDRW
jgi:competence protein ComEC